MGKEDEARVTIPRELEVKILRLFRVENWPIGTIATQLGVHHSVVRRVLDQAGVPRTQPVRPSIVDPFVPFILETWEQYPALPASRLYDMCVARGFTGKPDYFRQRVARYRPKPRGEAYLRLRTLPGEQAQVDWGHFGRLDTCGNRQLVAFVIVLSWSRAIYLRFFLGQQSENFLRGHQSAFEEWRGVPRVLLYDNLKSAVLERIGDVIRFNPLLLDFAGHYGFEPRPVAVARGNEKGRVERAIRYVRSSFFLAREWRDLDDLNQQALAWCREETMRRRSPEDGELSVGEALERERAQLLPLPETRFPVEERKEARVGKTPYVRFDGNDYSVPHKLTRRTLVVVADPDRVRVLHGNEVVAEHARSYGKREQIEDHEHLKGLVAEKQKASRHRGMDRLAHAAPSTRAFLSHLAQQGKNLGNATIRLLRLLDEYGALHLESAAAEVVERDVVHLHALRQVLERDREARGQLPATPVELPDDPRVRELSVRPHALETYDTLGRALEEDGDDDHESADD